MPGPQNACNAVPPPLTRLASLLAFTCLGSALVLVGGRAVLERLPGPDPDTPTGRLERLRRWAPDPALRREASLLLAARRPDQPAVQQQLLRGQGWGQDSLAALSLKSEALARTTSGDAGGAARLWRQLLRRFPSDPASADALYALGRRQPGLRQELRRRFPAHPAALAAALEANDADAALHLARWGPRWPGAEARLRQRCAAPDPGPPGAARPVLATALAELGDGRAALACLAGATASPDTQLAIGRSLLRGGPELERQGEDLLLQLARRHPDAAAAREAVTLLSAGTSNESLAALRELPPALQQTAPVAARRALASGDPAAGLAVLRRWPAEPASWELQWNLAREALLQGRWQLAIQLLDEPHSRSSQPPSLTARRLFWLGYGHWRLGTRQTARQLWESLLRQHPGGYYGWRASERLGTDQLDLSDAAPPPAPPTWRPLASGDAVLDRLWRLDQPLETWEQWRHRRGGKAPSGPAELLLEGRLRRAVGDHWTGLGQLEQASLRLPARACGLAVVLETELHRLAHRPALERAARRHNLPLALLAAVAKQESRFSPTVRSPVGAVGLLQLMPETAAELAGTPLRAAALEDPERNAELGALYLRQLLGLWQDNPLLVAASYNAGPGAVSGWLKTGLRQDPELWVEAIPYPETRLYVKKVLGNLWSFQQPRPPRCPT